MTQHTLQYAVVTICTEDETIFTTAFIHIIVNVEADLSTRIPIGRTFACKYEKRIMILLSFIKILLLVQIIRIRLHTCINPLYIDVQWYKKCNIQMSITWYEVHAFNYRKNTFSAQDPHKQYFSILLRWRLSWCYL